MADHALRRPHMYRDIRNMQDPYCKSLRYNTIAPTLHRS